MNVVIQLISANLNTGPFNLYSNSDVFTTPFATGISRTTMLAGYSTSAVPSNATIIRVTSAGTCQNSVDMPIAGVVTTTTTTVVPTTTTTTTGVPSTTTTTTAVPTTTTTTTATPTTTTTTTAGAGTTTTTTTGTPTTTTTTTAFVEPGPTVENKTFFTLN